MEDKNIKDFEYQYNQLINKGEYLKYFKDCEKLKESLFSEFTETTQKPDLYLFQLKHFINENGYWKFQQDATKYEISNSEYNVVNPYRTKLKEIQIEFYTKIGDNILDKKFYSHRIEETTTYKTINKIVDCYFDCFRKLKEDNYKDVFSTFKRTLERNLDKIKNHSEKVEVLKPLLEKKYDLMHALLISIQSKDDTPITSRNKDMNRKFFTEELDNYLYYKIKELESKETNADVNALILSNNENVFCKTMPIKIPIEHFLKFTTNNSSNGKPFLTHKQFKNFIDRAFCGNKEIEKQKFNKGNKDDSKVKFVFYEFYNETKDYFDTSQNRDIFIKLLSDNFIGYNFEKLKANFNQKPAKTI